MVVYPECRIYTVEARFGCYICGHWHMEPTRSSSARGAGIIFACLADNEIEDTINPDFFLSATILAAVPGELEALSIITDVGECMRIPNAKHEGKFHTVPLFQGLQDEQPITAHIPLSSRRKREMLSVGQRICSQGRPLAGSCLNKRASNEPRLEESQPINRVLVLNFEPTLRAEESDDDYICVAASTCYWLFPRHKLSLNFEFVDYVPGSLTTPAPGSSFATPRRACPWVLCHTCISIICSRASILVTHTCSTRQILGHYHLQQCVAPQDRALTSCTPNYPDLVIRTASHI